MLLLENYVVKKRGMIQMKDVKEKRTKQTAAVCLSAAFLILLSFVGDNPFSTMLFLSLALFVTFGFFLYILDKSTRGHWEYEPHTEEEIDEMFRTASENEKKRDLERQEELYKLTELCTACKQNKDYFMSSKTLPDCPQLKDSRRIECQTLKDLINRLQTVG